MSAYKVNLNFHQTFPPDANSISILLNIAEKEISYTKEEISDITGIPTGKSSGKVEPFIKYAQFMGLLNDEYKAKKHLLTLTELGREIKNQDDGLQEKATIYLCHANLVLSTGASLWSFVFGNIIPKYGNSIRTITFIDALKNQYNGSDVNLGPFYSSYNGMFKKLSILKNSPTDLKILNTQYKDAYKYIYAYILLKEWENIYGDTHELIADDLYGMNIDCKLCVSKNDFNKILHMLDEEGIIKIERLLTPFVVLKLHSSNEIVEQIYSTL